MKFSLHKQTIIQAVLNFSELTFYLLTAITAFQWMPQLFYVSTISLLAQLLADYYIYSIIRNNQQVADIFSKPLTTIFSLAR
jgi:TM2 domain-containing membrane protein YozV